MIATGAPAGLLQPGERVETLEIHSVLGRGRHGPMYLAKDPDFGVVAVKEYAPRVNGSREAGATAGDTNFSSADARGYNVEFAAGLTLFRLMGQALCNVRHPNLVPVRRCLEARGTAYLVMDYIEGPNLERLLTKGKAPGRDADLKELLLAVLGALGCLHGAGLIHRDVKPANIRLSSNGVPVLVDFGAALPADLAAEPPYKSPLTPGYAAPEHDLTNAREGPWTDLYGLAAVAYRILSGAPPPDAAARIGGVLLVPAVEAGRGRYSEAMLASIDRALNLKTADRPQSAQEWVAALSASAAAPANEADMICLPQPPAAAAADAAPQAGKADEPANAAPEAPRARNLWIWAAAVLVLIALPVAVVVGWSYYLSHIKSNWLVDARGNGDAKSLAQAMTTARTGATIHVRPGRYAEALVMARPLTIQGIGNAAEIVVAAPGPGPCVTITAEAGAISNLSFIGGTGSPHVSREACVEIAGASTVSLTETIIRNAAGTGLRIREDAAPVVRGNRIEQTSGPAVLIQDRATGTVTANAIIASGAPGVLIRDSAAPLVMKNRIDSAVQAGILVTGESTARIARNHITNSAWSGIEVRGRADPTVAGNRIEGAGQAGIYVYGGGRGTYQDNMIVGSAYSGVVVGAGAEPVMSGNRITRNKEHGIFVLAHGKGRYQGNTITDNAGHGLAIDVNATPVHADNALADNLDPQTLIGETAVDENPAPDPEPRSQLAPKPDHGR